MRVLYAYRYGIVGGVSTQLFLRKQALEQADKQCDLFFSQDNGLKRVLPPEMKGVYFGGFSSFRRLLKKSYDAIIVIDTPELLSIAEGTFWKRNKVYLDVHTTTETGLSYLKGLSLKKITGVMVPSNYSKKMVESIRPDCKGRLYIIPNILNTKVFFPKTLSFNSQDKGPPKFIWVGKLDKHKNWRSALVYAYMFRELLGDVRLYVIGGYTAKNEIAKDFFELTYRLGISDIVIWIDQVENSQLAELYRQCARSGGAMLVTSRNESFGMAAAEALLCGCPLISNNLPVLKEIFPSSPMLHIVDIWQPEQVLSAVENLISNRIDEKEKNVMYQALANSYGEESFLNAFQEVFLKES